jgi:hypothetical protein
MPTFDTPQPISVTLELGVGDVRIVASERSDTVVDIRPSDPGKASDVTAAEQTRVEYSGGALLVRAPKGWRQWSPWGPFGRESIDVRIDLPAGSHVRGAAGVAALRCTGRIGQCRYRTGVGNLTLEEAGPVDLTCGAGDVTVDVAAGRADITTAGTVRIGRIDGSGVVKNRNGDTWIGEITGEARVNASNGDISIDLAQAGVAAKTANGDVRLGEVAHGAVVAQSAFGAVQVGVRDGGAAWLDLETKFGTVQNDLDAAEHPEPGEDVVEVHAHTSMGDVTVHRSFASAAGRDEP